MPSRLGLLLFLVSACAPSLFAGESDALLRQRGEAFVAAFNAQGGALDAFARNHLESRLSRDGKTSVFAARMQEEFKELGPVDRHSIQIVNGGRAVFVFCRFGNTGTWQNYQFRVLESDESRLQLIFRAVAVEPMERPATPIESTASLRWLKSFQAGLEEQHPFSGVALVRKKGAEVFSLVKGLENASLETPMSRTTRMGMASGSKMFTAIAILQLEAAGKVSLSDPLIKYLKDFPDQEFARRATLHQLLTHTAGAGDYWDDAYEKAWGSITRLPQMLPFVLSHLRDSPAGEFSYSNSGYILLGLVVEAVTGDSYYDYVQTRILDPAGMTSTGFPIREDATRGVALPYDPEMDAGAVKKGSYLPVTLGARGTSAGGAFTTVDDMMRFADALRSGKLLDAPRLALLTGKHVSYAGPDSWYGYGTMIEEKKGAVSWGHGGSARGTQFEFRVFPDLDTVMVVISNYNTIAANEMASALDELIRNH